MDGSGLIAALAGRGTARICSIILSSAIPEPVVRKRGQTDTDAFVRNSLPEAAMLAAAVRTCSSAAASDR